MDITHKQRPQVIDVAKQPAIAASNPLHEYLSDSNHDSNSNPDISDYEDIAESSLNTFTKDAILSHNEDFDLSSNNHTTSPDTSLDSSVLLDLHNQCVHPLSQALDLASQRPKYPNVSISRRKRSRPRWLQSGDWDTD